MVSEEQYQYALRMMNILDMNQDDFLFDKYLNVALDYEIESGRYCANHFLANSVISQKQTEIAGRAASPVRSIVTFDDNPFYVMDVKKSKRVKS
ncbi:hypothetical protein LXA54_17015 [Erwinia amylovora]|uniref:hypothetical protein n=1 Tax=Erwinia amylovora TaxID=552 RepID=UPI0020BEA023|nr:hypothetical protein [Erwinia amylovora]MCK8335991.1 hypothetical protein [Erwinia amylovora]